MSNRIYREGLDYPLMAGVEANKLFEKVDATGGWPVEATQIGFDHTESRLAAFTAGEYNSGWFTIVATADDYYWWKLSDKMKEGVRKAVISKCFCWF